MGLSHVDEDHQRCVARRLLKAKEACENHNLCGSKSGVSKRKK
jgi:hypothetical protein